MTTEVQQPLGVRVAESAHWAWDHALARARERAQTPGPHTGLCAGGCQEEGRLAERLPVLLGAICAALGGPAEDGAVSALERLVHAEVERGCTAACLLGTVSMVYRSLVDLVEQDWHEAGERVAVRELLDAATDLIRLRVSDLCHQLQIAAIASSERNYRALIERASDAVVVVDLETGDIILANAVAAELTGYATAELRGMNIRQLHLVDEDLDYGDIIRRFAGSRPARLLERTLLRKGGEPIPVDITGSLVDFQDRRAVQIVARDSSERKSLERELARYAAELQSAVQQHVKELERLKELNERIVESLPSRLILLDQDLHIVHANAAYCVQRGVTPDEIRGKLLSEVFPRTLMEQAGLEKGLRDTLATGNPIAWTALRHATEDGHPKRVLNLRLDRLGARGRTLLLLAMDDVTDDARRVYELSMLSQVTEALQGTLEVDRLLHAILTVVTAGERLGFNRAFLLLVDEHQEALVGRYAVGPESAQAAHEIWTDVAEKPRTVEDFLAEYDHIAANPPPILELLKHLTVPLSRTTDVVVMAARNQRPYHVTDAPNDPRVLAAFLEVYQAQEFAVVPLVAKSRTIGVVLADNLFSGTPIETFDMQLLSRFANQAAFALDNANAYRALRERARQLERAYKELSEAQMRLVRAGRLAAVGEITAHMAHEIRTPLAIIGGFARRIQRHPDNAARCERNANVIVEETDRLEQILRNTLDFTRPGQPRLDEHNVAELLESMRVLAAEVIHERAITLEVTYPENLPSLVMDRDQLKQALLNLVKNAVQAMPRGGHLTIAASCDDHHLDLAVTDTGHGIEPDVMDSMFDAFFTTKTGGSGLGLAVTRAIVEDHEGEIGVTSQVGAGTTFAIRLPRRSLEQALLASSAASADKEA